MPELNRRQFVQETLPNFFSSEVQGTDQPGWHQPPARRLEDVPSHDPGPATKRGVVGEGQTMLNLDAPGVPMETSRAGLVPVDAENDPTWDDSSWRFGGMRRSEVEEDMQSRDHPEGPLIVEGWQSAPVEMIGPDMEVRTNQGEAPWESPFGRRRVVAGRVDVEEDKVDELREEGDLAFVDPMSGEERFPWIAQVEDKRYLMEGHHRAVSARERDTGEFPAHVIRGANWGQIEDQLYDRPWEHR